MIYCQDPSNYNRYYIEYNINNKMYEKRKFTVMIYLQDPSNHNKYYIEYNVNNIF